MSIVQSLLSVTSHLCKVFLIRLKHHGSKVITSHPTSSMLSDPHCESLLTCGKHFSFGWNNKFLHDITISYFELLKRIYCPKEISLTIISQCWWHVLGEIYDIIQSNSPRCEMTSFHKCPKSNAVQVAAWWEWVLKLTHVGLPLKQLNLDYSA